MHEPRSDDKRPTIERGPGQSRLLRVVDDNRYADWEAVYRGVNGPVIVPMVAAIRIMGLEDAWNHKALLDYADRYLKVNAEQIARVREALILLASQPPDGLKKP